MKVLGLCLLNKNHFYSFYGISDYGYGKWLPSGVHYLKVEMVNKDLIGAGAWKLMEGMPLSSLAHQIPPNPSPLAYAPDYIIYFL